MTEFELLEIMDNHATQQMMSTTLYFTLVSTFLVTTYLVGKRLARAEAVMVSSVYLVWVSFLPVGQYTYSQLSAIAAEQLASINSDFLFTSADTLVAWSFGFMVLQYLAVVASLYFMWRVRHSKQE